MASEGCGEGFFDASELWAVAEPGRESSVPSSEGAVDEVPGNCLFIPQFQAASDAKPEVDMGPKKGKGMGKAIKEAPVEEWLAIC